MTSLLNEASLNPQIFYVMINLCTKKQLLMHCCIFSWLIQSNGWILKVDFRFSNNFVTIKNHFSSTMIWKKPQCCFRMDAVNFVVEMRFLRILNWVLNKHFRDLCNNKSELGKSGHFIRWQIVLRNGLKS